MVLVKVAYFVVVMVVLVNFVMAVVEVVKREESDDF